MNPAYLDVAQSLVLVFGGVVAFYAWKGFRRTKSQAMVLLTAGFAFVMGGALVAGAMFNSAWDLGTVATVQAFSQVVGFAIVVYSITRAKS